MSPKLELRVAFRGPLRKHYRLIRSYVLRQITFVVTIAKKKLVIGRLFPECFRDDDFAESQTCMGDGVNSHALRTLKTTESASRLKLFFSKLQLVTSFKDIGASSVTRANPFVKSSNWHRYALQKKSRTS